MTHAKAVIAVDAVLFTILDKRLRVLLHRREKPPFEGLGELPGGLLQEDETAEQAVQRKLLEMVGANLYVEQFRTFSDPERDPRERTVSIGFLALVKPEHAIRLVGWHDAERLDDLAFDHGAIVAAARAQLKKNLTTSLIAHFLPREFALNRLQEAFEMIKQERYDNRNFRKRVLAQGIVEETGKHEEGVSHRPAAMYRFVE